MNQAVINDSCWDTPYLSRWLPRLGHGQRITCHAIDVSCSHHYFISFWTVLHSWLYIHLFLDFPRTCRCKAIPFDSSCCGSPLHWTWPADRLQLLSPHPLYLTCLYLTMVRACTTVVSNSLTTQLVWPMDWHIYNPTVPLVEIDSSY